MNRVTDPADPTRCKGAASEGQCINRAEHGSDYCRAHSGRSTENEEAKRLYLLTEARSRARLTQLSEHEHIKTLSEEIALTRMLIERRLEAALKSDDRLISECSGINSLLLTVERLVKSSHTIEQSLGTLLAKPTVLKLGVEMCQIVVEELTGVPNYEAIIDRITARLMQTIGKANNAETVK